MSEKHIGKVLQVIGPVLDIQFKDGELPELLNAIEIDNHGEKLIVEVAQLTGDNVARCIAMSSTDGLVRGTEAVDTGESIKVPVGDQCLGRVFNLLGEPVDNKPAPEDSLNKHFKIMRRKSYDEIKTIGRVIGILPDSDFATSAEIQDFQAQESQN